MQFKRVIKEAADMGYILNVGPEAEFFLFNMDEKKVCLPWKLTIKQDIAMLALMIEVKTFSAQMVEALKKMGFDIEASHHEVADGQHEIDFKYADALTTADNVVSFKYAVKAVARKTTCTLPLCQNQYSALMVQVCIVMFHCLKRW